VEYSDKLMNKKERYARMRYENRKRLNKRKEQEMAGGEKTT